MAETAQTEVLMVVDDGMTEEDVAHKDEVLCTDRRSRDA